MKPYSKYLLILSLFILPTLGCYKDSEGPKKVIIIKDAPEVIIDHNLVGIVNDQDLQRLNDVNIQYGFNTSNLNDEDFFHLIAKGVDKYYEPLKISYDGLTLHYPYPMIENTTNYAQYIFPSSFSNTQLSSNQSSSIQLNNTLSIIIEENSFMKEGIPQTGDFSLRHTFLNYTPNGFYPGGQLIQNDLGEFKLLHPSDYFVIDLESGLTFNGTIDLEGKELYLYNEAYNFWRIVTKENGLHLIENNGLYAIGSHTDYVEVSGNISSSNTNYNGEKLTLKGSIDGKIHSTIDGQFISYAPTNSVLTIGLDADCGDLVESIETQEDPIINTQVEFDASSINTYVVKGQIKDCQSNKIESSILKIDLGNEAEPIIRVIDKNDFTLDIVTCQNIETITLESRLLNGDQKSQNLSFKTSDTIDVFHVYVCNEYDEDFMTMEVDGVTTILKNGKTTNVNGVLEISFSDEAEDINIGFVTGTMRQGTIVDEDINIILEAPTLSDIGYDLQCGTSTEGCGFEKFIITEYGSQTNDFLRGYYKGRFWVKTYQPKITAGYKDIEGVFHIRRTF